MMRLSGYTIPPGVTVYKGTGCEHCHHQGYKGREGIFELLVINDAVRDLILTRPSANQIQQIANITTLREYGWKKVLDGTTTVEEVVRVSQEDEMGEGS